MAHDGAAARVSPPRPGQRMLDARLLTPSVVSSSSFLPDLNEAVGCRLMTRWLDMTSRPLRRWPSCSTAGGYRGAGGSRSRRSPGCGRPTQTAQRSHLRGSMRCFRRFWEKTARSRPIPLRHGWVCRRRPPETHPHPGSHALRRCSTCEWLEHAQRLPLQRGHPPADRPRRRFSLRSGNAKSSDRLPEVDHASWMLVSPDVTEPQRAWRGRWRSGGPPGHTCQNSSAETAGGVSGGNAKGGRRTAPRPPSRHSVAEHMLVCLVLVFGRARRARRLLVVMAPSLA